MTMNMDAAIRIKANVQGGNAIQAFSRDLKGLDGAAKLSGAELGKMNIAINRMAREAGNTTAGLRQHLQALQNLRDRVEIGSKAYNRLGGEIEQLKGKLRGLDAQAERTGSTLKEKLFAGLAGLGLGRMAKGITQTAANFDQEVRKAAAIEGGGNFDALRKSIEDVAAAAAGTPTQVAQLATALSRAGFTAQETSQSLAGIVKGAEATAISFEEMGSVMSDVMRSFGIDVSKTESVVDILVKTANSSNQTVLDLGEAMKYAAPVARTLGVNVNDLAATMALMANNGIRGSDAGTALRSGLSRLQIAASGSNEELLGLTRGSALLAKAMKTMGADVLDARGQLKPMDEVIMSLRDNMKKLPVGQRAEIAKALFGDEAGSKFLALLNSSEQQIVGMFDKIRNSGGAAGETQKQMQGFAYSLEVLKGNVEIVTNAIGEKFAMVLKPLADGLSAVIGWTQTWPKPLQDVASAAAAAGIAIGGFALAAKALGAIGAVTIIKGIAAALGTATVAAKAFAVALLANPIGLVVAGVAALTVAAYNLNKPFKDFVDTIPQRMGMFWKSLSNDATAAINRVKEQWASLSKFMGDVAGGMQRLWQDFTKGFIDNWTKIKNAVKQALNSIGINTEWLAKQMGKIANEIEYWWNLAFYNIQINWKNVVANMVNYLNPLFTALKQLGIDVGKATADALFGDVPTAPTRRPVQTSNIITAAPLDGPGGVTPGGSPGTGTDSKSASSKAKEKSLAGEIADALKGALNITDAQAAGIVGNFLRENRTLNPRMNEGGVVGLPRGIGGYGIAQHTGSRQTDLINFAGGAAQAGDLQTQLRFIIKELLGPENKALQSLRSAQTPEDAAFVFDRDFLRSGVKAMPERQANARQVFNEIAGTGPNAGLGDYASFLGSQNNTLKDAVALTKELTNANEDLQHELDTVGTTGVEAIYRRYGAALKEIKRDTDSAVERVVALNEASGNTMNIEPFKELINKRGDLKEAVAGAKFWEEIRGLLPTLESFDQQIYEGTVLLENRKTGTERLTEVQKLNLKIQEQGLEQQAVGNPLLKQEIALLREKAGIVDKLNAQLNEKSFDQGLKEQMAGLGKSLGDTLMSAFDNLISKTKTWKEFMSDALKQIGSQLLRMGLNMMAGPMGSGGILSFLGFGFAKGGIMTSQGAAPLKKYARGGIANSPQLAMFGEGSQPEAYVPLPDGRRIPVAMQAPRNDNSRMREVMGASPAVAAPPALNMKFETTKINGVEYVSREQLELAMNETRRKAARDGAKRGMSMTLDKLQQSPGTRSRVGIR
jgi:TP901 family phage tail tape measure protein